MSRAADTAHTDPPDDDVLTPADGDGDDGDTGAGGGVSAGSTGSVLVRNRRTTPPPAPVASVDAVDAALALVPVLRHTGGVRWEAAAAEAVSLLASTRTEVLAENVRSVVGVLRLLPETHVLACYASGDRDVDRRRVWVAVEAQLARVRR